jgi:transposase-like protein
MPNPGPKTIYKYTHECKATAVRLRHLPGVSVQDVATSLYIHRSCCLVGASTHARV